MNLLFVCRQNVMRSRTAEMIYKNHPSLEAKSAGLNRSARVRVTKKLIDWADKIFVMDEDNIPDMKKRFPKETRNKEIINLDVEDWYGFMEPELVRIITDKMDAYFKNSGTL